MCVCVCVCVWQREKTRKSKRVREYGRVCACERVCEIGCSSWTGIVVYLCACVCVTQREDERE